MKFVVKNAEQTYKLNRIIDYSKYSVLIAAHEYYGVRIYYGGNK